MPWANFGQLLMGYDSVLAASEGVCGGRVQAGLPLTVRGKCHLICPCELESVWQLGSRPVTGAGQKLRRMPHGKPEREFLWSALSHTYTLTLTWLLLPACLPATQIRLTLPPLHAFVSQLAWMAHSLLASSLSPSTSFSLSLLMTFPTPTPHLSSLSFFLYFTLSLLLKAFPDIIRGI